MKNRISTVVLFVIFFIGLFLLLYPALSNYWNTFHQSKAISAYVDEVAQIDGSRYVELWESARAYNEQLLQKQNRLVFTEDEKAAYESLLNVSGTGIIGYIEIPKLNCSLPIYHGTDESVLQIAVGHLEGSSLPIGGESSHAVLSGHRGLPSARLFTDLDQMEVGDTFQLRVLDETLMYEVDQIRVVEPYEIHNLAIAEGEDLCTLVTCTPYGVNSHRLLVRGHRVENLKEVAAVHVVADAVQTEPIIVVPFLTVPMLFFLLVVMQLSTRKAKKR